DRRGNRRHPPNVATTAGALCRCDHLLPADLHLPCRRPCAGRPQDRHRCVCALDAGRAGTAPQESTTRQSPGERMMVYRKELFDLPEGVIYLDGNSLGALPRGVQARAAEVIGAQWGKSLIRSWNDHGWMGLPRRVGDRIARLIGAPEGSVMVGDTLSIKVFQALAAALSLHPDRRVILSDNGNFPSDLYVAQGLIALKDHGYGLRLVEPEA